MYYKVTEGESLDHICRKFQIRQEDLMRTNRLLNTKVTPGQQLFIPFNNLRQNSKDSSQIMTYGELDDDELRQVPSPQETKPLPDYWPSKPEWKKGHKIAVFKAKDIKKDIPVYNSRAAYFFMSKMAVELTGCYSICDQTVRPCGQCFKSESTPFYVMPHNTNWVSLGDYGVVINTRSKKATYAICADWGPTHDSISLAEGTKFAGKIGVGSIHLGKQLSIKDIAPNPTKAFEPFGIVYIIFPGSANGVRTIKSIEEINKDAHRAFRKWGGWEQAKFVLKEHYNITL